MRKRVSGWLAVPGILVVLLGCTTAGDIPVGMGELRTLYISPANQDGVQDAATYPLTVDVPERSFLTTFTMIVSNERGVAVRTVTDQIGPERLLDRRAAAGDGPPEIVLWDGRDDGGQYVADGLYTVTAGVGDNRENTGTGPEQLVVVDNTPPRVELSAPSLLVSPNGDGILDELAIALRQSSNEDRWVGTLRYSDGIPVRTYVWSGLAEDFAWDGTTANGEPVPEGIYSFEIESTDRAGNNAIFVLSGLQLEREPRVVFVEVSPLVFSPNGDGVRDTLNIEPIVPIPANLDRWRIDVQTDAGRSVRTYTGTQAPVPVSFDGRSDDGTPVPDGEYRAAFSVTYGGGQDPMSVSPVFAIDTVAPTATVAMSSLVISPDDDGRMDTVEVFQGSSAERIWTGTFRRSDGRVARTLSWEGQVSNFTWDGTDDSGEILPDGLYTYDLTATDEAGNTVRRTDAAIRIDTRRGIIRILRSEPRISPNGDGVLDSVTVGIVADVTDGIERWVARVADARGTVLGTLSAGTALPAGFEWDGTLDGNLLPDGFYYPDVEVHYDSGTVASALGSSVLVDTTGPVIGLEYTPTIFSPGGDANDEVVISMSVVDPSTIDRWNVTITDPAGELFAKWDGTGWPPVVVRWNGLSRSGELLQPSVDYRVTATAVDTVGNTGTGETTVRVDFLVVREGDQLRISSIYFEPNTTEFESLEDSELGRQNMETLNRLVRLLKEYPEYTIRIEGHATHLLSFDPMRAQTEHIEVLVPLSFARAEAIRQVLVQLGIPRSRMTIFGHGGVRPVVPHTDELNRWKNRRVEFILEPR